MTIVNSKKKSNKNTRMQEKGGLITRLYSLKKKWIGANRCF